MRVRPRRRISWRFWSAISNASKVVDKIWKATFLRRWSPGVFMWWHFNGKDGCLVMRGIHNFHIWPPIRICQNDTIHITYTITDEKTGKEFAEFAGTMAFDQELVRQQLLHTGYSYYDNTLTEAVCRPSYPEEEYSLEDINEGID